jgi:nicotinamidase-related amidase
MQMIELEGKSIPDRLEEIADPKKSALLILNMQNHFLPRVFNSQDIVSKIKGLANSARQAGIPIFYSQQTSFGLKYEAPVWIRIAMRRAEVTDPTKVRGRALVGSRGWEVVDELKPKSGDIVLLKRRPSAFIGTDLDLMLRDRDINTVVLAGVTSDAGILGSARHGLDLGYYMVVLSDCVGSPSPEKHQLALKTMEILFDVVDSPQLLSIWQRTG